MIKKIIKFFLVLLCMATIFGFSSDNAEESNKKSDGVIVRISEFLVGHKLSEKEREQKIEQYVTLIRKSAHLTIYLILGFLLLSYLREYRVLDTKTIMIAFIIAVLYACSDEIHQLVVPGRSGEIFDVIIDSIGSLTGIGIYYMFYKWRNKNEQEKTIC